ncbi:thrombospondin [Micromonospora sediminicola]|uniref:thrombospondin n=1 Tax=Micromonospora sediminicola TaxID=946078 RepID=UPI0033AF7AC6
MNGDGVVDARDGNTAADAPTDRPVVTDRDATQTTYRSGATATGSERAAEADRVADADRVEVAERTGEPERRAAQRAAAARAVTRRPSGPTATPVDPDLTRDRTVDLDGDGRPDRPVDPTVAGPVARLVDTDGDGRPDRPVDTDGDGRPDREPDPALTKKPRASLLATLGLIVSVVGALFVLSGTLAGYGIGLGAVGAVLAVLGLIATRRRHVAGKTDALIGVAVGIAAVVLGVVAMTGQFDWPTTDGEWVGRLREWLDSQFADRF